MAASHRGRKSQIVRLYIGEMGVPKTIVGRRMEPPLRPWFPILSDPSLEDSAMPGVCLARSFRENA